MKIPPWDDITEIISLNVIYLLTTKEHSYTLNDLPENVKSYFKVITYDNLAKLNSCSIGALIFSDLDRLEDDELQKISEFAELAISKYGEEIVFNRPKKVLLRYPLLKKLYNEGVNSFNIFRANDHFEKLRYPAFVRSEHIHSYHHGLGLATNRTQLEKNISNHVAAGSNRKKLIVTEFCDVRDSMGIFNKYAAYFVNNTVIPRHLYFSKHWFVAAKSVRESEDVNKNRLEQHVEYLKDNPHESWIREMFLIARTDYGRIDYGLRNGFPMVWEINLNPNFSTNVVSNPISGSLDDTRKKLFDQFNKRFEQAMSRLNQPTDSQKLFAFDFS